MAAYPIPERESERLRSLHDIGIMDSLPDKYYDSLVELAAAICETPISAITLIDEDRQWFKSRLGIDLKETSRETAFCTYTILSDETLVVPDATQDPRFCSNPFVQGESPIRFYAGAPLVLSEGIRLGSLCVVDTKPRTLTPDQKKALEILAEQVVSQIELDHAHRQLERERQHAMEAFHYESLGRLANGVAHEINNPLAIIQAAVAVMERKIARAEETVSLKPLLTQVHEMTDRIASIVKGLQELARDESNDKLTTIPVCHLIEVANSVLHQRCKQNKVRLTLDCPVDCKVRGRTTRLAQALVNLLNNSFDAVEGQDEKWIDIKVRPLERNIVIEIQDSGPRIPTEVAERMMEPFFTTKSIGSGRGLGLSLARAAIEEQSGHLTYSEREHTTFVVTMPAE